MHQLQLTITDLVVQIHDTHHPISGWLYYEEQRAAAKPRDQLLLALSPAEVPRLFRARARQQAAGPYLLGRRLTYVDLSLFQIVEGLRYAFPKRMKRFERKVPRLVALHDRVAARPRIAAYLASDRRIPFNERGIFRRYPELDR